MKAAVWYGREDVRVEEVPEEVLKATDGVGADLGFECVGNPKTATLVLDSVRRAGKMVVLGVFEKPTEINLNVCVFFEKEIIGSLGYNDEFATVLSYLVDGRLQANPMITGKISLNDLAKEIRGLDREILVVEGDVTSAESMDGMVQEAIKAFGQIHILVNNANVVQSGS